MRDAAQYITKFQELVKELPDNENFLIQKFKEGLEDNIHQSAIYAAINNPTRIWTLQDWYNFAIQHQQKLLEIITCYNTKFGCII